MEHATYEPAAGPPRDGTLTGRRGAWNIWRKLFRSITGMSRFRALSTPLARSL
jgi:hypothetical protein